jgi:hypothetical protein
LVHSEVTLQYLLFVTGIVCCRFWVHFFSLVNFICYIIFYDVLATCSLGTCASLCIFWSDAFLEEDD